MTLSRDAQTAVGVVLLSNLQQTKLCLSVGACEGLSEDALKLL